MLKYVKIYLSLQYPIFQYPFVSCTKQNSTFVPLEFESLSVIKKLMSNKNMNPVMFENTVCIY